MEKEDIRELVKLQRKFPLYITLRWENIIRVFTKERGYTPNELGRELGLDKIQMGRLRLSMTQMKIRGYLRRNVIRYYLTKKRRSPRRKWWLEIPKVSRN